MCKVRMHRMANGFMHVVWPRLLGGWILRKACGKALSDICLAHNYVLNQNKVLEKSQKHLDEAPARRQDGPGGIGGAPSVLGDRTGTLRGSAERDS